MDNAKLYWSATEGMFNCLIDEERTSAFSKAISNTVRPGDVVVDLGTGTGILALLAAQSGARKVYAVETDARAIKTLEKNFAVNGFQDVIQVQQADARTISLPELPDVIICEMIATGLIEELQVHVMNNILQSMPSHHTPRVLLKSYECYLDLVHNTNVFYGFTFHIPRYELPEFPEMHCCPLSEKFSYLKADFSQPIADTFAKFNHAIPVTKDGIANGLRISATTTFWDGSTLDTTYAYSYPMILPLENIEVTAGQALDVSLAYPLCGGLNSLCYEVRHPQRTC